MQRRPHVGPVHLVGVEMAVAMPHGAIAAGVTGQRITVAATARIDREVQTQLHPAVPSPVGHERQVEPGAVPGDEHAGIEGGYEILEPLQQGLLVIGDDLGPPVAGDGDRYDGRSRRVEAAGGRVGLDVESVDGEKASVVDDRTLLTASDGGLGPGRCAVPEKFGALSARDRPLVARGGLDSARCAGRLAEAHDGWSTQGRSREGCGRTT